MLDARERTHGDEDDRPPFKGARQGDISGGAKTEGRAKYTGDLEFEGLLEGGVVRSPHPHAEILSIDLTAALAVPGVVAAVTAEDFPPVHYLGAGGALSDRPPLARKTVRYVGEEVAAIAAASPEALARALALVRVRYRRRRPVFDAKTALSPNAPRLHETSEEGNIVRRSKYLRGDPARQGAGEVSVRARYSSGSQAHCCLETHTVVAHWPDEDGPVDVWAPSQGILKVREELAHLFGIAEERIRTHDVAIGGDFGSRVKISTTEAITVALARKSRRPVRIRLSREEEFAVTKRRYPFETELELTADTNGKLTRLVADAVSDMGAYHHVGAGDFGFYPQAMASLYSIENVSISMTGVYTNQNPPGSFRGAGGPQSAFARESAIDELARKLGLDPFEIRLRNLEGAAETASGWKLDNVRMRRCLERAREEIGWAEPSRSRGRRRGFGVAAAVHVTGVGDLHAEAYVDLDRSGRIIVRSATADPGTGQRTILAQVAAHELGVQVSDVEVVLGEASNAPYDPGLGASKGSYISTNAVGAAARDLATKLRAVAARRFGVNEVTLADGKVLTSAGSASFAELAALSPDAVEGVLRGNGAFNGGRSLSNPDPSDGYAYAAQAVEVEVDEDLGTVRVVKVVAVHDSGTILNPILARGQIEGGIVMAMGAALGEELIREGGRIANTGFADYACPRAADVPEMKIIFVDSDQGPGRYGANGLAEICLVPTAAAIANAIADAVDVRVRDLPITPDKIVNALSGSRSQARPDPIVGRPGRWWTAFVRALYPLGLHHALHHWGGVLRARRPSGAATVTLVQAGDLASVVKNLGEAGARPLAGGTDLMLSTRQGLGGEASEWVDLTGAKELGGISRLPDGGLRVGATVTLAELGASALVPEETALKDTVLSIASPQIRHMATLGGNLCQTKRCWFYRHDFECYKRAGPTAPCYAVEGDHRFFHSVMGARRCQAVTPSDLATTLTAVDAEVLVRSARGDRRIPLAQLYVGPGETCLEEDELLVEAIIPHAGLQRSTAFRKMSLSQGGFAVCSAAASVSLDDDAIGDIRIVIGGVAPTPFRAVAVERVLAGRVPTQHILQEASAAWVRQAHPLKNNGWKLTAATALVERAVEAAVERARAKEAA